MAKASSRLPVIIAPSNQRSKTPPGIHTQIAHLTAEIAARWAARAGISFEHEQATEAAHAADIEAMEGRLARLADRLPRHNTTLADVIALARVAHNWRGYPGSRANDDWPERLIDGVLQMATADPETAAQRVQSLIDSRPRSPSVEEIANAIGVVHCAPSSSGLLEEWRAARAESIRVYDEQDAYINSVLAIGQRPDEHCGEYTAFEQACRRSDYRLAAAGKAIWAISPGSSADLMAFASAAVEWWDEKIADVLGDASDTAYDMKGLAHLIRAVCEFCGEMVPAKIEDHFAANTTGPVERLPFKGDYGPVCGSDGKPVAFDYTNDEFAQKFLPTVRILFGLLALDRASVTLSVKSLLESIGQEEGEQFARDVRSVSERLHALGEMATAGAGRIALALEDLAAIALEEEQD